MKTLRVATRASDLAMVQAGQVAAWIERGLGVAAELVPMKTTGDRLVDAPLARFGGKGLFVKEIEEALLDGRADLAVHSAKDLPASLAPGLELVAFPERGDPRDALVLRERGGDLAGLPAGARVGTGSVRRASQLRAYRNDLEIVPLRGNVPTRLRKLEETASDGTRLDAVVLACAGLDRLQLSDRIDERIAPDVLLPAVGQGALAIEGRVGDPAVRDVAGLSDRYTVETVAAERGFLTGLAGDCNVPLAALAEHLPTGGLRLRALLSSSDGAQMLRHEAEGPPDQAAALGAAAADGVRRGGGDALLAELHAEAAP